MTKKYSLFFLFLCILISILIGCNKESNGGYGVIVYKNLPINVIEKDNTKKNYLLYITSNGLKKKDIAMYPIATSLIARKGKSKFEVAVGATYQIDVYQTNLESIEELHKEPKKEPTKPSEKGEKPLLVHQFTAREDMTEIKLKIPEK